MASAENTGIFAGVSSFTSQASDPTRFAPVGGKILPQSGNTAATAAAIATANGTPLPQSGTSATQNVAAPATATSASGNGSASATGSSSNSAKGTTASSADPQTLVNQLNKYLNDSGRSDEFRLDPDSDKYIQQVNPSNGAVVAEYLVSEFPALARSVGASGLLIDAVA